MLFRSFEDETFKDVALKMERWFDVEIEIKSQKLMALKMTGNFEKETITQALEALKDLMHGKFNFDIKNNKIIIQ